MSLGADEILSLIILLVALYIFYKAIKYNWKRWKFFNHCEVTKAQVVQKSLKALSNDNDMFDQKTLRFVNNKGQLVTYKTRWLGKGEKGQELHSDGVEIIYDFTVFDQDGDNIYFEIDWDDGFVEDVVQMALVRILKSIDTFKGNSAFSTWALAIGLRVGLFSAGAIR